MKTTHKITAFQICLVAMAACVNVAGGQISLFLHLPIYLDSIGTILAGAWMGPVFGMAPNLISGVVMGMTTDIYSLYFAPVGMITGLMSGLVFQKYKVKRSSLFLPALMITVPGTVVSSMICAFLFGGITSSGSTVLVQLLAKTPLGMTASVFVVQILTDYADRLVSLFAVVCLLQAMPSDLRWRWKGENSHGRAGRTI
ncbi:MAG: ECF transporter S component [Eubacteriales bacterium]|nr:ECF transporter S component [Eubacteriales bacterium]